MGSPEPGDRAGAANGQVGRVGGWVRGSRGASGAGGPGRSNGSGAEKPMSHDEEIDKELRFHIDSRIADLIAEGLTPEEARRRTRLEFGGVMQTKEAVRDLHLWSFIEGLFQDLRLAFRTLRATPVVTFVAVLSLALGIGANTAMFSLVNSLLLRSLPVQDPARLVLLRSHERKATRNGAFRSGAKSVSGRSCSTAWRPGRRPRAPTSRWTAQTHQGRRVPRQRLLLRHARRCRAHRPHVLRRGRSARRWARRPGRGDQLRLLAAALRRRARRLWAARSRSRTCRSPWSA